MPKPIKIEILGDAKNALGAMGKVERGLGSLGRVAGIAGAGLAAGLGAGATALFKIGETFQNMEATIVRGTGATGEALEDFAEEAKEALAQVPESAEEVGAALADINTFFGVTGDELSDVTEQFLDFARVADVEVNPAIEGLDGAMTQFGEPVENLDEVMGDLLRITQATGVSMGDMLGRVETFGPIFANAGFSLEETAGLMGQLEQSGVEITRVGPGLNAFFRRTAEAGEEPRRAFENIVSAMDSAESSTEALNIATEAFGAEGAQRMTSAIRDGNFDLERLNELLGDGTGLVAEQEEATRSFSDRWDEFKNNVLVKLEPLATKFFDAVEKGLDEATKLIGPFLDRLGDIVGWFEEDAIPVIADWRDDFEQGLGIVGDAISDWRDEADDDLGAINSALEGQTEKQLPKWQRAWENAQKAWAQLNETLALFGVDVIWVINKALLPFEFTLKGMSLVAAETAGLIGDAFASLFAVLEDLLEKIAQAKQAWNDFKTALTGTLNPRIDFKVPSFDVGGIFDRVRTPFGGRAMGINSHPGGPVEVGERGREVVDLPAGSRIRPNHMGGGRGGNTFVFNGSNLNATQVAREIAWHERIGDGR